MALEPIEALELARAIDARRELLLAEIRRELERTRIPHMASLVDHGQAEVTRNLAELSELDSACTRIADATYGLCTECGSEIPLERLRAELGAARCIVCQQRHEKADRS